MDLEFILPPGITYIKKQQKLDTIYEFYHEELGTLGRVILKNIGLIGQCNVSCEIIENPDDPLAKRREELFKPLGLDIAKRLSETVRGITPVPSVLIPIPQEPKQMIQSKMMQCKKCDSGVAYLIFAVDAEDFGGLEDYARKMFSETKRLNLPTWVIGPMLKSDGPIENAPAPIMKVWPNREPMKEMRPDEFNPILDNLAEAHCK